MTESTKTLLFVAAGVVAILGAYASQPSNADFDKESLIGAELGNFAPEDAKRLKITEFDEDTATLREFAVAQDDTGLWTLPSKNGYPADAERQMGEAAGSLLDREVLAVASDSAADHEQYGVIDPTSPKLEAGQKGVGTRVTVSDISDNGLIDLIIGKEVKDAEEQRYVREHGRDLVYVIEIDPEKLSTKFEDWIESDLLGLNSWDIRRVQINDYSFGIVRTGLLEFRPDWNRRGEYVLTYNDDDSKWEVDSLKRFDNESGEFVAAPLAENEELDTDTINDLKSALDDLEIVDVEKKPSGLSANLSAGEEFLKDEEALGSLSERGFMAVQTGEGQFDLLSGEGEVIATMKNGVEYVLRFGDLQMTTGGNAEDADATEGDGGGVNRYLFVSVRMNEDFVEKPELAELPELPENANESQESNDESQVSAGDESASADDNSEEESTDEESAEEDEDDPLADVIAERKRIEEENQRKLDEYKEQLDEGREKVKELNTRFGDWYYVIANDVFKKIHLSRDDLVKVSDEAEGEEEAAEESTATDESEFGAPGETVPGLPDLGGEQ